MKCIILPEKLDYDGSQISSLWAYSSFGVQEDSVIVFRGACDVKIEHMIDLEDRRANESIWSEDMLSFIIEHFDSTDMKLIYSRQRLFTAIVREYLEELGINTSRAGDDLFFKGKKLTVSIASTSAISQKIHFGINVSHEVYGNLKEAGIEGEENIVRLMQGIGEAYVSEFGDIEKDLRKSRPLGVA
ncbi:MULTISPECIES: DUF366 family protein [Methanosarcina]|jgi:hypothetical protein|uniref:DUF366 family protein n=7 Tax=Methanosarcina mazei TaxID=2209 RepID=A0A0F8QM60_METMZ|nr:MULTISPECIES: DUF366 family protein [Methanosarcina]AAM30450.1 conserved protein [Methanosarcina mazei Go1]AGF96184.1 Archaeosine cluster gene X [Methanosarcina mazei Tuc01]AKB39558.1 hypothetical protein MSMAW_0567 [Methanosarcina mazei WWM610]AKB63760.1 hypothetical protein MSMAS_0564 [Methanosarcina mazei S-6]AKB67095.1 hypothetical protein MSMAL_0552 [Methanosarcina mazei LYC]